MTDERIAVLVVEDEFIIAENIAYQVEQAGFRVCGIAADTQEALSLALSEQPLLVLMDVRLRNGDDGVETASAIRASTRARIIFLTGSMEPETARRIASAGSSATLYKPVPEQRLIRTLRDVAAQID